MRKVIIDYYAPYQAHICSVCQKRLIRNPLRVLDCKEEKCQPFINAAPAMIDYLCSNCKEHFKNVLELLEDLNITYDLNPRLVRGLDYYTKTVFEIISPTSNLALGGGGRYDNLIELFGGPATGGIGFAGGIERVVNEMKLQKIKPSRYPKPAILLIHLGDTAKRKTLPLFFNLQKEGFNVMLSLERESLRSQLNFANKLKVSYALILGQKEIKEGTIILKNMLDGAQETVPIKKLSSLLKERLYTI